MQWWSDFVDWLNSDDGWRILSGVVFPALAIIVAGFIAALIGRSSTRRLLVHHDREYRTATVTAMISAARRASKWNVLSGPEQEHADHLAHDADISLRLLPLNGAALTADWAAHEIAEMKKNSVSFSFQAEQSLLELRDRLVTWQTKPSRAKKLFKPDLELWAYESSQEDRGLVEKQQEWAKQQVAGEALPDTTTDAAAKWRGAASPATPASGVSATSQAEPGLPQSDPDTATALDASELSTPSPVSAHAVRQRTTPTEDDELR